MSFANSSSLSVTTKQNYIFKGWCTINNSSDPTTCTGTNAEIIQPGNFLSLNTSSASITKALYAVWRDNVKKIYMQDATLADCGQTMYDKRDEKDYTTALINGQCWMTQNLRFTGTSLSTTTSNVSADKTISYGDLTSGNSYTEARIHNSGDTTTGVWYNFCAAGANESNACNNSGSYSSSYDICPKNWHLPTNSQFTGITSYIGAFSIVTGGIYDGGSLSNFDNGYWWSATAYNAGSQLHLYYLSNGSHVGTYYLSKFIGSYVRCVRSS